MRIAYLVDIHGRFDAVPRALDEIGEVDLVIIGGDITTGGTADDAQRAIDSWRALAPQVLAVAGNMDSAALDARLADLDVALDGRGVTYGDIGVFGVSAARRSPLRTPYEPDEHLSERAPGRLADASRTTRPVLERLGLRRRGSAAGC